MCVIPKGRREREGESRARVCGMQSPYTHVYTRTAPRRRAVSPLTLRLLLFLRSLTSSTHTVEFPNKYSRKQEPISRTNRMFRPPPVHTVCTWPRGHWRVQHTQEREGAFHHVENAPSHIACRVHTLQSQRGALCAMRVCMHLYTHTHGTRHFARTRASTHGVYIHTIHIEHTSRSLCMRRVAMYVYLYIDV